jgi:hypothetical protein
MISRDYEDSKITKEHEEETKMVFFVTAAASCFRGFVVAFVLRSLQI